MNLIGEKVDLNNLPQGATSLANWFKEFQQAYKSGDAAQLAKNLEDGIKLMGMRIFEFEALMNILKNNPEKGKQLIQKIVQTYEHNIPRA